MKKGFVMATMICLMSFVVWGCGKESSSSAEVQEDLTDSDVIDESGESGDDGDVVDESVASNENLTYILKSATHYEDDEYKYEEEYDENGFVVKYIYREADGTITYYKDYENDENGNVLNEAAYGLSDNGDWYVSSITTYEYDDNGNLIKETGYGYGGDELDYTEEYEYDQYGNQTKEVLSLYAYGEIYEIDRYEHEYDEDGNLLSYIKYDKTDWETGESGLLGYREVYSNGIEEVFTYYNHINGDYDYEMYEVDEKGNHVAYYFSDWTGELIKDPSVTYENEYDDNGRLIRIIEHDNWGDHTTEIEYDDKGEVIKYCMYNSDGEVEWGYWPEFEYDDNGNLKTTLVYNYYGEDYQYVDRIEYEYEAVEL